MRVNLISNHRKFTGLSQDVSILRGLLYSIFEKDVEINLVQYIQPECPEAEVNIFVEFVNPSLFSFAAKNIWIPNPEYTPKTWLPYMHMMTEIWAKTYECQRIFQALTPTTVRYIGWTSLNKITPKKNFFKAIVPIGKNMYREYAVIFLAYQRIKRLNPNTYTRLPILNIVCWYDIEVPEDIKDHVVIHKQLSITEYDALLGECGLCICLSEAEGFGHAVNEAMASGCNLILSNISPFYEHVAGSLANYCNVRSTEPLGECFGNRVSSDLLSLVDLLEDYTDTSYVERSNRSEVIRHRYEENHKAFMDRMTVLVPSIFQVDKYVLKDLLPKEDELPDVSIVCVTRDRREFMPILKYSYMIQSYPEDKLELIIVDDGDDSIEDTLLGVPNVVYVRCEKMSIGAKRNLGVSKAMYDVVAFMDDDDVYPNNSVLERVAMMLKAPSKECSFSTTIPCYDISKYSSFMNSPPLKLPMSERVSEATLTFTKGFWEENKFADVQIAEGNTFISGREYRCREISPQNVIVSLTHPKNSSSRKIPNFKEPNGCHYGFNEKLYLMVSEIGESLKTKHAAEGGGA